MPWFKVDDGFHGHPKVIGLSPAAVGLWLLAGTWSAQYLTDGAIPSGMVTRFGGGMDESAELVYAGLWEETPGGFQFHEWAEYQPTKEEVSAERAVARERMRASRAKRKRVAGNDADGSEVVRDGSEAVRENDPESSEGVQENANPRSGEVLSTPTQPGPARPVPDISNEISVGVPRKRGSRIPDEFFVTAEMREWAAGRTPLVDVNGSTERFVNHWQAKAGRDATKLDWVATWRNWLIRDQDDAANRKLTPMQRAAQTAAAGRRFEAAAREVGGSRITTLELTS